MGEIAEALRRARQERTDQPDGASGSGTATPRPSSDVYSTSARIHEEEDSAADEVDEAANAAAAAAPEPEPRTPSPPAPPPAPADSSSVAGAGLRSAIPGRAKPGTADDAVVELTHEGLEAQAPQGVIVDDGGAVTDACLQLALRVRKALLDRDARTLAVVSALRNEGKTTVSCNLALAMAAIGEVDRVALVDLDLRRPSVETVLELTVPTHGIEDVLSGDEPLLAARIHVASPNLDVYPCLRGQLKAHELLLAPRFAELVAELRDLYDVVIFDSPPTLLVPDSTIIMQNADCFAPVARAGITRSRNFRKMLETLPRRRMLGAILDGGASAVRKGYYHHYGVDEPVEDCDTAEAVHGG